MGPLTIERLPRLMRELEYGETDTEQQAPRQRKTIGTDDESADIGWRASYRFKDQIRKLEAESWRQRTPGAEQQAGSQTGLEAPTTQSLPMKYAFESTGLTPPPGLRGRMNGFHVQVEERVRSTAS